MVELGAVQAVVACLNDASLGPDDRDMHGRLLIALGAWGVGGGMMMMMMMVVVVVVVVMMMTMIVTVVEMMTMLLIWIMMMKKMMVLWCVGQGGCWRMIRRRISGP
jgi:hypothetical protein